MRRTLLCALLLVAGCYQKEYKAYYAQWEARNASFASGTLIGQSLDDVVTVWGKADEVEQSLIGDTHIGTLIYRRPGYYTYHLVFVDGYLDACHKF